MSGSIFRHLALLFVAAAFVLATALPNSVSAMAGPPETPCRNCPDKAPAGSDLGKMACGALACAGVAIGLPVRHAPYLPAFSTLAYSLDTAPEIIGAAPMPDPYPPRPIVLG